MRDRYALNLWYFKYLLERAASKIEKDPCLKGECEGAAKALEQVLVGERMDKLPEPSSLPHVTLSGGILAKDPLRPHDSFPGADE